jgi:thiol-disulfide isomerase/thioredoxin
MKMTHWITVFVFALLCAPAQSAEMKAFGRGTWQAILKEHAGTPVVIHLWGLTCAPCLTELPHWAKLEKERANMKLIMIAADPTPADPADLTITLDNAGLQRSERWMFADAFSERLRFEVDPKWRGEMPRTILIGADGTPTIKPGLADLAAIRRWLDSEKAKAQP